MNNLLHRPPSVGSLTKKILAINPDLTTHEVISIVRKAVQTQDESYDEFAGAEYLDESIALELARSTLTRSPRVHR